MTIEMTPAEAVAHIIHDRCRAGWKERDDPVITMHGVDAHRETAEAIVARLTEYGYDVRSLVDDRTIRTGGAAQLDIAPPRSGKSTRMLDWLQDAPDGERRVLVSAAARERDRMQMLARTIRGRALDRDQFVTLAEVQAGHLAGARVVLAIDNLDLMLDVLLGHPVARASLTELAEDSES